MALKGQSDIYYYRKFYSVSLKKQMNKGEYAF